MRGDRGDRLIRPLPALLALAAGVGASVAIAATGSTELGDTTTAPTYGAEAPVVQLSTTPGTKPYTTPAGVLTSWRYHSSPDPSAGTMRLQIFRPAGGDGVYEAVAESGLKELEPSTGYEFAERIPVEEGWVLGLDPGDDAEAGISVPSAPDDRIYQFGNNVPVGATRTATGPFQYYRVNVAATVEPDADGDGYGDETQDRCPTDPLTHDDCPPDTDPPQTGISKAPPDSSERSKARYEFASDEPGSSFECKLKGKGLRKSVKKFKACDSPHKYKRLDEGRYGFKVRATDAAGNTDPSPAKDKFRVVG